MIGVNTSIFKSAGRKLVNLLGTLKNRATYYENGTDSTAEKNRIESLGILDDATILLTPTATSDARVHSVKTYTGDDYVVGGDFSDFSTDWTTNTATEKDGVVTMPNNSYIFQSIGFPDDGTIRIRVEGSGTVRYRLGVTPPSDGYITVSLPFTIYEDLNSTDVRMQLNNTSGSDITVTSISIVNVSSDFNFDRASSATRINSDGLVQDMQSITDPELVLNGDFEDLSDELVTNGTFDTDSGWSFYNADADTNTRFENNSAVLEVINSQFTRFISTTSPMTVDKFYKITYEVTETDNTDLSIQYPATTINSSIGTHTVYIKATNVNIGFSKSNVGKIIIDNVSVQQVDPNDRWSLTSQGDSTSIITDKLTLTCDDGDNVSAAQSYSFTDGNTYKLSFDLTGDNQNKNITIRDNSGATGGLNENVSLNFTGTETKTFIFTANSNSNSIYTKRVSLGTYSWSIDNVSLKDITFSADVDLARINYDSNGDNGHILLEPTSTNLITYSEDFSEWNKGVSTTVTPNFAISPDGTQNATRFQTPTGSGTYLTLAASMTIGNDYTLTLYLKNNGGENVDIGVAASSTVGTKTASVEVNLTNEWVRYELNFTADSNSNFVFIDNISNANSVDCLIWGAQLEELSYPTSYIPNHGSAAGVTRATEKLTGSGNSTLINSREGVLYAEIKVPQNYGSNSSIAISNGTTDEYIKFIILTTNNIRAEIKGSLNAQQRETSFTYDAYTKIAISYSAAECKFFINGSQIGTTITTHTLPSGLDTLEFARGDGQVNFYGKCKALAVFDRALTDQELTDLTT